MQTEAASQPVDRLPAVLVSAVGVVWLIKRNP